MTKTTTVAAISVTLLLMVGGSLHLIQRNNRETASPAAPPRASEETNPVSLSESQPAGPPTQVNLPLPASPKNTVYLNRLAEAIQSENIGSVILTKIEIKVVDEMDGMHLETLIQMLVEARTDDRYTKAISLILEKIAAKSAAHATTLAAEMVVHSSPFDISLSYSFGEYFREWLETDRAAADRWYFAVMASGELIPKHLPEEGRKIRMPDRVLMLNRFKVMMNAGSEQAISMAEEMTDEEIVYAMYSMKQDFRKANTSPGFISRIVRNLPPERQVEALGRHVDFMAQRGFANGSGWLDAVDIADSAYASLRSRALVAALEFRRVTQSEALEIIDGWPDSPVREDTRRKIIGK